MTFDQSAGNAGARTPGVDHLTVAHVRERIGIPRSQDDPRTLRGQAALGRISSSPTIDKTMARQ